MAASSKRERPAPTAVTKRDELESPPRRITVEVERGVFVKMTWAELISFEASLIRQRDEERRRS